MAINKSYRSTDQLEVSMTLRKTIGNDVKKIPIKFRGGATWPSFKGGSFHTSDPEIQSLLESSPLFGVKFILEKAINTETREILTASQLAAMADEELPPVAPEPVVPVAKEEPVAPIAPVTEETAPAEPILEETPAAPQGKTEVTDIETPQEASAYLRKLFPTLKARDVNTKESVLQVAAKNNIVFTKIK
jgi:hypothetical protein